MRTPSAGRDAAAHPSSTPRSGSAPEERYAALVRWFLNDQELGGVAGGGPKGTFGSSALKVSGKIFAMLSRDRLVVKLPRGRADALISRGEGERFDPGHGRLMKEWLVVYSTSAAVWRRLALEAMTYVAAHR